MRTVEVVYGVATAIKIGRLRDATTGLFIAAPDVDATEATITQDDGVGQDQTDNAPSVEADGNVIWTISAAEAAAPSAGANERIFSLIADDDEWIPVEIRILTTDHQSASKPNGVIRQVTPDATPGATSVAVTDAALPTTALGAKFINAIALVTASDVADDLNCSALVTGYSKTGDVGTFTYAGGWNRTPTGTAASISINFYAAGIGATEKIGSQVAPAIQAEMEEDGASILDEIRDKTTNLPTDPADQSLIIAATDAIITDTEDIQARLPAALGADGFIKASIWGAMGTALTETAGQIAAAFTKFFNKAAPTGTVNSLPDAVAGAASGVAIVGSQMNLAADAITSAKIADNAIATEHVATGTLTAAKFVEADPVPVNVVEVNDVAIVGDGDATPFNVA